MIRPQCPMCGSQQYYYPTPPSGNRQGQRSLEDYLNAYAVSLVTRQIPIEQLVSASTIRLIERTCHAVRVTLADESPVCLCKVERIRVALTNVIMSHNTND